jgi:hypothetical protein
MRHILLALIFVFAAFPLPAEAQSETLNWEIGWETETDPEIMELNGKDSRLKSQNGLGSSGDMTFSLTLEFWVDNPRPLPVEIEFDCFLASGESSAVTDFEFDCPDVSTINGLSNESFSVVISGDGFDHDSKYLLDSADIHDFSLTANELVAGRPLGNQQLLEKDLQFSKYNAYRVYTEDFTQINVYSGWVERIELNIENIGNAVDTIIDTEVEIKSCPQLVIEGLEDAVGKNGWRGKKLKVTAPQSHPEKECEVVFKVRSEGSGLWYSNYEKFTINVIAPEAEDDTNDDTSSSDQETGSGDLEINDSGILPSLTILSTLSMVGFAAILGRDER